MLINKVRLIDLKDKVIDCIGGLDRTVNTMQKYKDIDPEVIEMCDGNFRSLFNGFQALVEDYTSITLKTIGVSVSDKHFRECLRLCVSEGFLTSEFVDSFEPAIRLRNKIAHGYKQPSIEILIEYYKSNRHIYNEFLKCISNTVAISESNTEIKI